MASEKELNGSGRDVATNNTEEKLYEEENRELRKMLKERDEEIRQLRAGIESAQRDLKETIEKALERAMGSSSPVGSDEDRNCAEGKQNGIKEKTVTMMIGGSSAVPGKSGERDFASQLPDGLIYEI